jgi:hypothetical protein
MSGFDPERTSSNRKGEAFATSSWGIVVEDEVLPRLIEAASADEAMVVLRTGTKIDLVLTHI